MKLSGALSLSSDSVFPDTSPVVFGARALPIQGVSVGRKQRLESVVFARSLVVGTFLDFFTEIKVVVT